MADKQGNEPSKVRRRIRTAADLRAKLAAGPYMTETKGLRLLVRGSGAKFWSFRYERNGRAHEMGLGPASADGKGGGIGLAEARERADAQRHLLNRKIDPLEKRKAEKAAEDEAAAKAHTFRDVADLYIGAHEAGWRNAKHRAQWTATLTTYAFQKLGEKAVGAIGTDDVLGCLNPIWTSKPETASRVRGRIEAVLDYAAARNWRSGPNPARWRGHLSNLLPRRSKVAPVEHHAALPWQDMGAFLAQLRTEPGNAALAMQFCILTATRTGETIGARWSEVDMDAAVWTIPGARMKAGREHRVPLSPAALAVLNTMAPLRPKEGDGHIFPGGKAGKPLSSMAMLMLLRRMKRADLTVHGFRSTFRDWCEEATTTPHAVAEAALAHTIGDKVEAAYRRGDLFAKRAKLMAEWADYCAKTPATVVHLADARAG